MIAILAGSDTTATVLRGIVYHLARSPRVYTKLKAEIRDALACQDIPYPIPYSQAKELPYLQVREAPAIAIEHPSNGGVYKRGCVHDSLLLTGRCLGKLPADNPLHPRPLQDRFPRRRHPQWGVFAGRHGYFPQCFGTNPQPKDLWGRRRHFPPGAVPRVRRVRETGDGASQRHPVWWWAMDVSGKNRRPD